MGDVVVTVPKTFTHQCAPGKKGLAAWAEEGDLPGSSWSHSYSVFTIGGCRPCIEPGERVYVVCEGRLRGYAPLVKLRGCCGRYELVRGGDAVAVTIPGTIKGFRSWRRRWWEREVEVPFPNWREVE